MTAVANDNACRTEKSAISRFVRKFIDARRARRGMHEMLNLGDHILRDIGVSRSDIHAVMKKAPRSYADHLAAIAEENRRSQFRLETMSQSVRQYTANEQVKLAA